MNKKIVLIIIFVFLLSLPIGHAWWGKYKYYNLFKNDHGELTNQALDAVDNNDTYDQYLELYDWWSGYQNEIATAGNSLDDQEANYGFHPRNTANNYINFSVAHFYHPNGSTINNQWSSALVEANDWLQEAISDYSKGEKKVAYTKLGYMMHLLEDMAVPAHSHLAFHGEEPFDYLEFKADADEIDATSLSPIQVYNLEGNELYAIERQFNQLAIKSNNESDIQSTINTYYRDGSYIGSNQACGFPLIGQTCSPQITSSDVTTLQNDLMPKAVQYSAGLAMRVHNIFKSLDWPTYHHDNRRTGFTLLKGDLGSTNTKNDLDYVLQSTSQTDLARPSIADIDNDGNMDVVITSSSSTSNSYVFVVEKDKQTWYNRNPRTYQRWKVPIAEVIKVPPTLADTDNDNMLEAVFGLENGTLFMLDNNQVKWTFTVDTKYSSIISDYIIGNLGYVAVSDIDNDGKKEIIFTDGQSSLYDWPGHLYILRDNGNTYEYVGNISIGNTGGGTAAPAIANVDNDDNEEIIIATYYGVRVYDFDSGILTQKCANISGKLEGAPVLYDIDKDNKYEIVYTSANFACGLGGCSNEVHILNADTCNDDDSNGGFSVDVYPRVGVAIANLDTDGNYEIVVNGRTTSSSSNYNSKIRAYDAKTDNQEWEYATPALLVAPNIADIDGNGKYNIIITSNSSQVIILNEDGSLHESYNLAGQLGSSPAIGDIDGDGIAELAVKRTGSPVAIFSSISGNNHQPLIAPIDNITAIAGELINLNYTGQIIAIDSDNNNLTYYYSSPFNSSGLWQSNASDEGNYSILIEVSDGNLSSYQYIDLKVFSNSSYMQNMFTTNQQTASLIFTQQQNKTVQVRLPKNANILYSKIKARGSN